MLIIYSIQNVKAYYNKILFQVYIKFQTCQNKYFVKLNTDTDNNNYIYCIIPYTNCENLIQSVDGVIVIKWFLIKPLINVIVYCYLFWP